MLTGLTQELSRRVEDVLSDMLIRSEAEAVFLCNKGGYILAESVMEDYEHNDNIAALAAGSFFATREIARLVGEPEFRHVLHRGDSKSIFMQSSGADFLTVVVFGEQSNPGLVKLCADELCVSLDAIMAEAADADSVQDALQAAGIAVKEDGPLFHPVSASQHPEVRG